MVRSLLILLACASCVRGAGSYRCANDNECLIDGVAGQCEAIGYCSFPDGLCETGYRFGSYSGMYANACVTPGNTGYVTVGGDISGLVGTNLVLRNNGADDLLVTGSGPFSFETALMNGVPYEVTVAAQPSNPQQSCSVSMGAGVTAMDNITDVEVACATTTYMIGGTVVGLIGTGMVLTLNGGNDRTITGNGSFAFVSQIASGEMYTVAIKTQPIGQICNVSGATGTVGAANVSSIVVNCTTGTYTVGGTVSGIEGSAVLRNNGTDSVTVTANGTFAFPTPLSTSASYTVTVMTQPTYPPRSQTCTVTNGAGTVGSANVTTVAIACTTSSFTVGGSVTGLSGTLVLQNNSGDDLTITQSGTYTFATPLASGTTYNVTIAAQPGTQTCSIATSPTGTVGNNNVTNIAISCGTAGADPGILCGSAYCDPGAGQLCCIDGSTATCQTTSCTGAGKRPIRCDTQADCAAAGSPQLVCCGTTSGDQVLNSYCAGASQCQSPEAYFCDPNITTPCPHGGTCTAVSSPFPGNYRCL